MFSLTSLRDERNAGPQLIIRLGYELRSVVLLVHQGIFEATKKIGVVVILYSHKDLVRCSKPNPPYLCPVSVWKFAMREGSDRSWSYCRPYDRAADRNSAFKRIARRTVSFSLE